MASSERVVVVAVDDSRYAENAFNFYVSQVKKANDTVCVLYVPETLDLSLGSPSTADAALRDLKKEVDKLDVKYKEAMKQNGCEGKFKTSYGKPGEVVCQVAKEEHANLIVIGSRGLGKIRRTFLGSVSDYVVQHAHVPVFVCKVNPESKHQQKQS